VIKHRQNASSEFSAFDFEERVWPICEILGSEDNRDQSVDFQRLRESDLTGLIEKRPSASAANRPASQRLQLLKRWGNDEQEDQRVFTVGSVLRCTINDLHPENWTKLK
jgi:hypothetical protein